MKTWKIRNEVRQTLIHMIHCSNWFLIAFMKYIQVMISQNTTLSFCEDNELVQTIFSVINTNPATFVINACVYNICLCWILFTVLFIAHMFVYQITYHQNYRFGRKLYRLSMT